MAVSATQGDLEDSENEAPLETDPTNRFQRCDEVLGEGAYKLVYRACDLEEGNEVAWNQLRFDHLSKREAQKILSEIEILQSIRNDHIINFYASWSTPATHTGGERIVFITELMSSGTLKQYLKKTLKGALKPKVVKSWCRQILQGLAYLHTHSPPIIHRDLKCDNIFINGNNGQLKIGDLGLAVVRHRTHVSSVLGTPEFMAPELYDEKYDEKVDIYAFGMCVLEMVTKDYPYAECTNQAQIYRKVSQGIKPQALEHVQDPEIREFIDRCLDHDATTRPSAQELLDSDFLKPCAAALTSPYAKICSTL
ncbi:MAG: kinase-like domain-containing protein [Linnemannia elongata]|nr:MAG: kinase-like domain-containing protein [Linnemannia elongata]